MKEICVVGGGVSGLTCAHALQDGGLRVRIVAQERWPQTTSAVAAAIWYPYKVAPPDRALAFARRTYEVFRAFAAQGVPGIWMRSGMEIQRGDVPDPWWCSAVPDFERCDQGWRFTAPVVEMPVYLDWLERRFLERGGAIELRALRSFDALQGEVIVNCSGLGARELCDDRAMTPSLGQLVHVRNPGLSQWRIDDEHPQGLAYVIPRGQDCALGGTAVDGDGAVRVDPAVTRAIVSRCVELEPALAGCQVLGAVAGLRPLRPSIRLEVERLGGRIVVHDYGHGGGGVTLSWGCAEEVARLVAAWPANAL